MDYFQFIKYSKGLIPLIISVPHGGTLECENIPKRINGIMGIDKGTIQFAKNLINYIEDFSLNYFTSKKNPSYIIAKVRRNKIDLNRNEKEAFSPNSNLARKLYQFYHNKIKELINYNLQMFNYSLLIDIHGFDKNKRPQGYRDVEIVLGTQNLSTFYNEPLSLKNRSKNLRGDIIKKFLELNIPIAPGHPRRSEYILKGGFITQQYGASNILGSQTIQMELSDRIRISDKELRKTVLDALANIILKNLTTLLKNNFNR